MLVAKKNVSVGLEKCPWTSETQSLYVCVGFLWAAIWWANFKFEFQSLQIKTFFWAKLFSSCVSRGRSFFSIRSFAIFLSVHGSFVPLLLKASQTIHINLPNLQTYLHTKIISIFSIWIWRTRQPFFLFYIKRIQHAHNFWVSLRLAGLPWLHQSVGSELATARKPLPENNMSVGKSCPPVQSILFKRMFWIMPKPNPEHIATLCRCYSSCPNIFKLSRTNCRFGTPIFARARWWNTWPILASTASAMSTRTSTKCNKLEFRNLGKLPNFDDVNRSY